MNSKYWAFICHHNQDVGHWGGHWTKKEYDLKEFKTEEELDEYIKNAPECCDENYSLEIVNTSYDNMEQETGCGDE